MANGHGAHGRPSGQQAGYSQQGHGRLASQALARGGYRPLTPEASQYSHYNSRYQGRKKKKHTVRNVLLTLLVIIVIVGAAGGYTGWTLYNSAKQVRSDASVVMSDISDLKGQVLSDDPSQASSTAADIAKRAANMKKETTGWAWDVACYIPVYGPDVEIVRDLSDVLDDLARNAIVPLADDVSQMSLKNLLSDGAINVELAQRLVNSVSTAAPVIERCAQEVDDMGDAHLEQINGPLEKARESLGKLNTATQFVSGIAPAFADMLGVNGQRTYLIVAQSCAEIRSTGGFLGSVGPLYLNSGAISLGEFRGIADIYPGVNGEHAPITDEERAIFGEHVAYQIADSGFIPDFARVSEIVKFAWEQKGNEQIDGVIGVDPMFLQDLLGVVGAVTTSAGVTADGSNTAQLLLRDVYYLATNAEQDAVFEEVAALSFNQLMLHLGDVSLTKLAGVIQNGIATRHIQVWMNDDGEESAVSEIGADGTLSHDAASPTLGVFFSEESYSKLFWYFKVEPIVGEGARNADGSTTYPVTVTYWNMVQAGDEDQLPSYARSHNGIRRSDAEMIVWVMLSAPEGGSISDVVAEGEFVDPALEWRTAGDRTPLSGTMTQSSFQGLDFWYGLTRTMPGGSFTLRFNVTTSPAATEPLAVVRTPEAQEVAGW